MSVSAQHRPLVSEAPLKIRCFRSESAFTQLKDAWKALEHQDTHCTPFNTWLWNQLWWQHYATDKHSLALLVVQRGARVVAIAPLYVHATRMCKVIPVRVLRFIGTGGDTSPDYLNIIALPACRGAAEQAVLNYLPNIENWQKLLLTDMAKNSTLAARVEALLQTMNGELLHPQVHTIKTAQLPESFEAYRMKLSRKRRKQINHRKNRLHAAGQWELSICASPDELAEATDALVSLHRLRWQSKQQKGGFSSMAYEQFHRAVIAGFFAADSLWLATLKLDGQIIGVQYIFAWRGSLMFMQSGYSPDHESLSPGHVLFTYVIARGIEQGMSAIDMLKGQYDYKSVYAPDENQTIDLGLIKPGLLAFLGGIRNKVI